MDESHKTILSQNQQKQIILIFRTISIILHFKSVLFLLFQMIYAK